MGCILKLSGQGYTLQRISDIVFQTQWGCMIHSMIIHRKYRYINNRHPLSGSMFLANRYSKSLVLKMVDYKFLAFKAKV